MNVKSLLLSLLIFIGIVGLGVSMTINKTEIPKAVKEAFAKKYPTAQKVEWETEENSEEATEENGEEATEAAGEEEYEVKFKLNGIKSTAKFKADGTWLETESKIKKSDLPQAVKTAITTQFSGFGMEEAELVETPEVAKAYEVKLKDEKNETEVKAIFSPDGKLLEKKVKNEEEEGEEENEDSDGN
jgi:uncharacterized lipoprotein NlpE involved in copper resistance